MEVNRVSDPSEFRRLGEGVLMADAARNNMPLAILQTLLDQPEVYPDFNLWLATIDGEPRGLALQTPPHNVLLAEPLEEAAVEALADAIVADGGHLPGVLANLPWADRFAERITELTGRRAERVLAEGVWQLQAVYDVPTPSGKARAATPADRDLLRRMVRDFEDEALPPEHPRDEVRTNLQIDLRLAGDGGGYWLWEDGERVSISGFAAIKGVGSRIGPVYTPPLDRRRGYAGRLVAELSAARLASGDPACFLFTDLANPTSNALYARIGYTKLCEAVEYAFRS